MKKKLHLEEPIVNALKLGNKLQAIKLLRETRGFGLIEARNIIELYTQQNPYLEGSTITATDQTTEPTYSLNEHAIRAIQQGKKITAIKIVREDTGLGLKEAKEMVEHFEQQLLNVSTPLSNSKNSEVDDSRPHLHSTKETQTHIRKPKDSALAFKIVASLLIAALAYLAYRYFS